MSPPVLVITTHGAWDIETNDDIKHRYTAARNIQWIRATTIGSPNILSDKTLRSIPHIVRDHMRCDGGPGMAGRLSRDMWSLDHVGARSTLAIKLRNPRIITHELMREFIADGDGDIPAYKAQINRGAYSTYTYPRTSPVPNKLFQIIKSEFQDLKTNDPIRFREDMLHNRMMLFVNSREKHIDLTWSPWDETCSHRCEPYLAAHNRTNNQEQWIEWTMGDIMRLAEHELTKRAMKFDDLVVLDMSCNMLDLDNDFVSDRDVRYAKREIERNAIPGYIID